MLMKVAGCKLIVQHAELLPSDATTLYHLTRHERGLDIGYDRQEPGVEIFPFRSFRQQEKGLASKN